MALVPSRPGHCAEESVRRPQDPSGPLSRQNQDFAQRSIAMGPYRARFRSSSPPACRLQPW
jgi:hypothetical protein